MTQLKFLGFLLTLGSAVLISACSSDDDDAATAPQTTSQLADQEIADNTNEVIAPLSINELNIPDDDTNETALPRSI